jgi:transposase
MSFTVHKTIKGKKYAYEITSYWDAKLKKVRKKSKYLGIPNNNIIKKKRDEIKTINELFQLDFGDGYLLNELYKKSKLYPVLEKLIVNQCKELIPLMYYRLTMQSAMYNAGHWITGNITNIFFKNVDISSQNISEILKYLGNESIQREFFLEYIKNIGGSEKAVIIDATSLPNQIHTNFNAWGYAGGTIEKQFKLLCVLDIETKTPLFYRYLPGNLADVSTLQRTIIELSKMGIKSSFVLIDAGYLSEENVINLYKEKINFLSRLPSSRTLYKELIETEAYDIEDKKHAVKYGTRGLFVKCIKINLYEQEAYAFLVLDPIKKGKETQETVLSYLDDKETSGDFKACGTIILISSLPFETKDVVENYYTRQAVEQVFGFYKDDLQSLPLRCHSEDTIRGYLFLQFIVLILFLELRSYLKNKFTVEQALLITRNIKCKIFKNQLLVAELTKNQKQIFELCDVMVPKIYGI